MLPIRPTGFHYVTLAALHAVASFLLVGFFRYFLFIALHWVSICIRYPRSASSRSLNKFADFLITVKLCMTINRIENPYVAFRVIPRKFDEVRPFECLNYADFRGSRRERSVISYQRVACNCEVILFHSESLQPARAWNANISPQLRERRRETLWPRKLRRRSLDYR